MQRLRLLIGKGFHCRYGPIYLLVIIYLTITFSTRVALLIRVHDVFDWSLKNIAGVFGIGLLYDLAVSSYIIIPFVVHIWFTNEKAYAPRAWKWTTLLYLVLILLLVFTQLVPEDFNADLRKAVIGLVILRMGIFLFLAYRGREFRHKWRRAVLFADFGLVIFLLLFNAVSEWFFWNEFSGRYNFIAVDYLIYTNEVVGNIRESYPVGWIIFVVVVLTFSILYISKNIIRQSTKVSMKFSKRSMIATCFLLLPAITTFSLDNQLKKFSNNAYANELAGNGLFEFAAAFHNNELDFYRYYKALNDEEAFRILREQLTVPNSRFLSDDPFDLERQISYASPEKKMNVVMISVESLSASFMKAFGNDQNITPCLDSLSQHGIFFRNLYASGTRTVRGLEALSLSIPPTPGQSVVKRPENNDLFSLGSVFRSKGYTTQYIYGGYGYFDNMNAFFSGNGYEVVDRTALKPEDIHYANIWGVADEDLFTLALNKLDENYRQKKPFFSQIMTVSNHRPYTYPDGRIDIPSHTQSREGAVKYTDYAIGKFIREASVKPWFNNTVFVIVADHCAGSAGSVELPVTGYHIPMLIYSPANIAPQQFDRLTAQIDIAPTILGLLKFNYRSRFFGQDIFALPEGRERALISTYQGLGYLRNNQLVIQSPVHQVDQFRPDFATGNAVRVSVTDSLAGQAIAYYQAAAWLLKHKKYNK
ncbi:LTA synthase family protein [Pseudobacter ginsenosidimutans]|uniref:Phosphoglycerol transferase MdoB-like AlkP superfamily enzyme n=1 Tax=Pseudobacter ginsenosidimutans TaxID=661488 RepID=A0A4Q7MTT2_9BACT|nr:LTA synthase family protein [Pseudobacter ginsenosidimutans]QEC41193.1 LTA synthase family protein [Pseudobacter ginsenosidimutans]RZS72037.1 phosphoglycerol transferase MdoB-like AlkP superfamily enzyme [Pseudobacter ginsenosidimutans]